MNQIVLDEEKINSSKEAKLVNLVLTNKSKNWWKFGENLNYLVVLELVVGSGEQDEYPDEVDIS